MDSISETLETWNQLADIYHQYFGQLTIYDQTYLYFLQKIPLDKKILELGCGPATITKFIFKNRPDLEILATDVSENMISLSQKLLPEVRFLTTDLRDLRGIDENFDAFLLGFCLPYIPKEEAVLLVEKLTKMANENAVLYVSFVPGEYKDSTFLTGSTGLRTFFYYYPELEIIEFFAKENWICDKRFEIDYPKKDSTEKHLVLIFKRQ